MDIGEIRKGIDRIDQEIIRGLDRRMELALRLKRLKGSVREPERESKVFENVRACSRGVMRPEFSEGLYRCIMDESSRVQQLDLKLIGFQGEHGAYSEAASRAFEPSLVPIPYGGFSDVFDEVISGQIDFGMVPVENSLEGPVTEVNDLLVETDAKIVGEVTMPIHHCLLARPHARRGSLRVVYSHPQALAQCRGFITRHRLEARSFYDTAGAARMLSEEGREDVCVIANRLCAELYELKVVCENIEDHESNTTRFVVLSKQGLTGKGDKCSVVFSLRHRAGALFSVLKIFSDAGINLTRIESRPARRDPGSYVFFLDFEGSDGDVKVTAALERLRAAVETLKFLGCYRRRGI